MWSLSSWNLLKHFTAKAETQDNAPVVIVGGGVAGSSTAYHLAKSGQPTVLIDANHPIRGSWGESRNVPIAQMSKMNLQSARRGMAMWKQLEHETGLEVLVPCAGSLNFQGEEGIDIISKNYNDFDVPFEVLDENSDWEKWAPGLQYPGMRATWVAESYVGKPQNAVEAFKQYASSCATCDVIEDSVVKIDRVRKEVITEEGRRFRYSKLILACGVWTNSMLRNADLELVPIFPTLEMNVNFACKPGFEHMYAAKSFPLGWGEFEDGTLIYWTPRPPGGVEGMKVGLHVMGAILDNEEYIFPQKFSNLELGLKSYKERKFVDNLENVLDFRNMDVLKPLVQRTLPFLDVENYHLFKRCLYAMVPDGQFIVGYHADDDDVILACGFSGEGFKHSIVIGELVKDILLGQKSWSLTNDMRSAWSPKRFKDPNFCDPSKRIHKWAGGADNS